MENIENLEDGSLLNQKTKLIVESNSDEMKSKKNGNVLKMVKFFSDAQLENLNNERVKIKPTIKTSLSVRRYKEMIENSSVKKSENIESKNNSSKSDIRTEETLENDNTPKEFGENRNLKEEEYLNNEIRRSDRKAFMEEDFKDGQNGFGTDETDFFQISFEFLEVTDCGVLDNYEIERINNITEEFKATEMKFVTLMQEFDQLYIPIFEEDETTRNSNIFKVYKEIVPMSKTFFNLIQFCTNEDDVAHIILNQSELLEKFTEYLINYKKTCEVIKEQQLPEKFLKFNQTTDFFTYLQCIYNRIISYKMLLTQMIRKCTQENEPIEKLKEALELINNVLTKSNDECATNSIQNLDLNSFNYTGFKFSNIFYDENNIKYELYLFEKVIVFTIAKKGKNVFDNKIEIENLSFFPSDSFFEFKDKISTDVEFILKPDNDIVANKWVLELIEMVKKVLLLLQ